MTHARRTRLLHVALLVGLVSGSPLCRGGADGPVKLEWFGWSFFRFTSPTGKVILTNPFITGKADAAIPLDEISKADLILVPNGCFEVFPSWQTQIRKYRGHAAQCPHGRDDGVTRRDRFGSLGQG